MMEERRMGSCQIGMADGLKRRIFKKLGYSIIDGCAIFRVDDDLLDEREGVYSLTEQKIACSEIRPG